MTTMIRGAGALHHPAELPPGTIRVPLRAAGAALAVSGVLLAVSTPVHPNILDGRDLADAVRETASWRAIHVAWVVSSLLNIFGVAGIVAVHGGRLGRPGQAALALTIIGTTATACLMSLEAVAFPPVAHDAPELLGALLNLDGPLLGSPLLLALSAAAAVLPVGFVALGVVVARCDIHARAGVALAATTVAFETLAIFFVPVLGPVAAVAFGAVLGWWGWLLWRAGRDAIWAEPPAE